MTIQEYARAPGLTERELARGKQFSGDEPLVQRLLRSIQYNIRTGCWLWLGSLRPNGYGRFSFRGEALSAHRTSYEYFVGPIPAGLELDHLCRVPRCINPAHLEPVTTRENWLRSRSITAQNVRRDECDRGHPREGDHIQLVHLPDGRVWKKCKLCKKESGAARYQRNKQLRGAA